MSSKYIVLISVLLVRKSCLGDVTTVIELKEDLINLGCSTSGVYYATAPELPNEIVPIEILNSGAKGIWQFTEEQQGGIILIIHETSIDKFSFKYYSAEKSTFYFQDTSVPDVSELSVPVPATNGKNWTSHTFEFLRDVNSTKPITIRVQFPPSKSGTAGYLLIDSITITEVTVTTTTIGLTVKPTYPTTVDATSSPTNSDTSVSTSTENSSTTSVTSSATTQASSSANFPAFITFASLAVLKAFM